MTNKEFAEAIKKLTKPTFRFTEVAKKLGVTPQRLSYYTKIKAIIHPDEQNPFNLDSLNK